MIPLAVAHWRTFLVLALLALAGAVVGVSRHQLAACRTQVVEFRRAYDLLANGVQRQNEAVTEWQQRAAEAQQRAATARRAASGAVAAAEKSSDALAAAMHGARPAECPTQGAVAVVREDLQQ